MLLQHTYCQTKAVETDIMHTLLIIQDRNKLDDDPSIR